MTKAYAEGRSQLSLAVGSGLKDYFLSLPEDEHSKAVLEILKYPTAAGPQSTPLLGTLSRFGLPENADLRSAVALLESRFPALDFGSVPKRP